MHHNYGWGADVYYIPNSDPSIPANQQHSASQTHKHSESSNQILGATAWATGTSFMQIDNEQIALSAGSMQSWPTDQRIEPLEGPNRKQSVTMSSGSVPERAIPVNASERQETLITTGAPFSNSIRRRRSSKEQGDVETNATSLDATLERKRLQNALAARRSRARKLEEKQALQREVERERMRAELAEETIRQLQETIRVLSTRPCRCGAGRQYGSS